MKNNASVKQFGQVMQKYRLADPVPAEVQRHIRDYKRRQFNKTLRRTAGYSSLFVLISNLFFTLRRYGLSITIAKSAILLGVLTMLTAAAFTTVLYWFVLKKVPDPKIVTKTADHVAREMGGESGTTDNSDTPSEPPAVIEDRLGVQAFTGVNVPGATAAGVSDRVAKDLAALRGGERVVNLRYGRGNRKSGMMLFGNVESADGGFTITARVVSIKDSRILFYDSEGAVSEQDIDSACGRLAKKIYDKIQ